MITRSLLVATCLLTGVPALAADTRSVYTTFDTARCHREKPQDVEDYGSWTCAGLPGLPIRIAAGDQRMYVAFGPRSRKEVASETLPGFNSIYAGTVEWRLAGAKPFAAILRWTALATEGGVGATRRKAQVLVVTRVGVGESCHVGYIDAQVNRDANQLARALADELAPGFRCGVDKPVVRGRTAPDLPLR